VQKAEVTHPLHALGQHVHGDTPQEVGEGQRESLVLPRLGIAVTKGERLLFLVEAKEISFRDHTAIQVARQVLQCRQSLANVFAVHDPLPRQHQRVEPSQHAPFELYLLPISLKI
jgi:hypothetical protein